MVMVTDSRITLVIVNSDYTKNFTEKTFMQPSREL